MTGIPENRRTVREVIALLMDATENLPDGLDSPVDLAICDGSDQQFIDRYEVTWQHIKDMSTGKLVRSPEMCVILLGHWHRGESPGRLRRAATADVDEELRGLVVGDPGDDPRPEPGDER